MRIEVASLLWQLSWPELQHHIWRHLSAWFAVVLGVSLAFAVHLINESALGEFSAATSASSPRMRSATRRPCASSA